MNETVPLADRFDSVAVVLAVAVTPVVPALALTAAAMFLAVESTWMSTVSEPLPTMVSVCAATLLPPVMSVRPARVVVAAVSAAALNRPPLPLVPSTEDWMVAPAASSTETELVETALSLPPEVRVTAVPPLPEKLAVVAGATPPPTSATVKSVTPRF